MGQNKKPGSRIEEWRKKAELTQQQLATLVGVTPNTIQNWESGKSGVEQIEKFLKLCAILDCRLDELIYPSESGLFSVDHLKEVAKERKESGKSH
jgi:transcriptional regulator with XRE-family HTH domain